MRAVRSCTYAVPDTRYGTVCATRLYCVASFTLASTPSHSLPTSTTKVSGEVTRNLTPFVSMACSALTINTCCTFGSTSKHNSPKVVVVHHTCKFLADNTGKGLVQALRPKISTMTASSSGLVVMSSPCLALFHHLFLVPYHNDTCRVRSLLPSLLQ